MRDLRGALHLAVLAVGLVPGALVAVGGAELDEAGQQRLELGAVHGEALGAGAGHGGAVVGALAEHDHVLGALALVAPVLPRHLDGGLHRLAAAEGEEDVVEVAGRQLGDLGGELDGRLVGDLEDVVDRQLLHLRLDGVVDLGAAVADVDGPQAGEGVDVLVALGVVDDAALGPVHDDGLEVLHLRERRPEVPEEVLLERLPLKRARRPARRLPWLLPRVIHPGGKT